VLFQRNLLLVNFWSSIIEYRKNRNFAAVMYLTVCLYFFSQENVCSAHSVFAALISVKISKSVWYLHEAWEMSHSASV